MDFEMNDDNSSFRMAASQMGERASIRYAVPGEEARHTPLLTERDWFAMSAIPALITAYAFNSRKPGETNEQMFARKAYAIADAMIAERIK